MRRLQELAQGGLYEPSTEHANCGVGFMASLSGVKSHDIVEKALQILCRLEHRGACGCDPRTGDGAGILIQLPHKFLQGATGGLGFRLPDEREYGTGLVFLPPDAGQRARCEEMFEAMVVAEGQAVLGWRDVPRNSEVLGIVARSVEPTIRQVFIARGKGIEDDAAFER